jgi:hypothetical protein
MNKNSLLAKAVEIIRVTVPEFSGVRFETDAKREDGGD